MQTLIAVCNIVCAYIGGPQNLEDAGVPSPCKGWLTPWKHASPPPALRAEFGDQWFGVAVTRWSRSTQLLYIEPG